MNVHKLYTDRSQISTDISKYPYNPHDFCSIIDLADEISDYVERREGNVNLEQLIDKTIDILHGMNYTEGTWKHAFRNGRCSALRQFFSERGKEEFCVDTAREYIAYIQKRYENGEFSFYRSAHLKKMAAWLIQVHETGELRWKSGMKSKISLNSFFEDTLEGYLASRRGALSERSIVSHRSDIRHLLGYLQHEKDYVDFARLTPRDVQAFMLFMRQGREGRLDFVAHSVRSFLSYLNSSGLVDADLSSALRMRLQRPAKIMSRLSPEEIDLILSQPNRDTAVGKRDYAILMLGKSTGLRRGDIVNLKRSDIDWKADELRITQSKTGVPLVLPLEPDTEDAIVDYLLNGRPKSNLPYVFLRGAAPRAAISPQLVGTMFGRYLSKAGISHTPGDGKSFHGLRRSMASLMLEADIPLTTISQVLGHRKMDSAAPYLSVDEKNLRRCALGLKGIEVRAEGLSW